MESQRQVIENFHLQLFSVDAGAVNCEVQCSSSGLFDHAADLCHEKFKCLEPNWEKQLTCSLFASRRTEVAVGSFLSRVRTALPRRTFQKGYISCSSFTFKIFEDMRMKNTAHCFSFVWGTWNTFDTFCWKSTNKSKCRCLVVTWKMWFFIH